MVHRICRSLLSLSLLCFGPILPIVAHATSPFSVPPARPPQHNTTPPLSADEDAPSLPADTAKGLKKISVGMCTPTLEALVAQLDTARGLHGVVAGNTGDNIGMAFFYDKDMEWAIVFSDIETGHSCISMVGTDLQPVGAPQDHTP